MKKLVLCIMLVGCGSNSKFSGDDEGQPDASESMNDADIGADASSPDAMVCTANTQGDPNNCGACGRSCLGSACTLGQCAAERLDSGDISGIGDFTTDGLFLYYTGFTTGTGANHRLWKLVIGPATAIDYLTAFTHLTPLSQLAFDGTDFYTAEPVRIDTVNRGTVKKVSKEPFAESNIAQFQKPTTTAVLQQGGFVYYATDLDGGSGGDIKRVSTTGGAISTITALAGVVAYLGADSSNLFWVDNGGGGIPPALHRAPIGGGATIDLAPGIADFLDMDATNVYMVRKNTGELISVPKAGGTAIPIGQGMTAGGAVDDEYVYAVKSNKLVAVTKTGVDAGTLWEGEPQGTQGCPTVMKITRTKVIGAYVYFLVVPTTCNNAALFNQIHRIARM
jgi:hypothetical protein